MARVERHEFKNLFLASPTTWETTISATSGMSMISPSSGELLEVWQIDVDGQASNSVTVGVEIRDGATGNIIRFVEVGAGDTKIITFGGLPKKFTTSLWAQTFDNGVGEAARMTVHYVPRRTR